MNVRTRLRPLRVTLLNVPVLMTFGPTAAYGSRTTVIVHTTTAS